jgi:hypothetical protein
VRASTAGAEAALLLFVADREPVLDQEDPVLNEQPLEDRTLLEKAAIIAGCAEPHHVLDACAVVPAPIKKHDLACRWQVRDVALKVPLTALALSRRG